MSSREHGYLLEKTCVKCMYVCEEICGCVRLCRTSSGEFPDCVCLHGGLCTVRLACLRGRATDWAAHTHTHSHISKRTFDVAELYLAASSGGDFSRVTISKRRQPQCLSTSVLPKWVMVLWCKSAILQIQQPLWSATAMIFKRVQYIITVYDALITENCKTCEV